MSRMKYAAFQKSSDMAAFNMPEGLRVSGCSDELHMCKQGIADFDSAAADQKGAGARGLGTVCTDAYRSGVKPEPSHLPDSAASPGGNLSSQSLLQLGL